MAQGWISPEMADVMRRGCQDLQRENQRLKDTLHASQSEKTIDQQEIILLQNEVKKARIDVQRAEERAEQRASKLQMELAATKTELTDVEEHATELKTKKLDERTEQFNEQTRQFRQLQHRVRDFLKDESDSKFRQEATIEVITRVRSFLEDNSTITGNSLGGLGKEFDAIRSLIEKIPREDHQAIQTNVPQRVGFLDGKELKVVGYLPIKQTHEDKSDDDDDKTGSKDAAMGYVPMDKHDDQSDDETTSSEDADSLIEDETETESLNGFVVSDDETDVHRGRRGKRTKNDNTSFDRTRLGKRVRDNVMGDEDDDEPIGPRTRARTRRLHSLDGK